ncbi:MAG: C39 family peptidase [Clostridia bacterium]
MKEHKKPRALWWILALFVCACFAFLNIRPWGVRISQGSLLALPLILQADYPEPVTVFGGREKSVATSGCGAVSVAMAARYLTGNDRISPDELLAWAVEEGRYAGDGLSHETLSDMLKKYRLKGTWVENSDLDAVRRALNRGYPVIAHMGAGTFTQNGHYILLIGIDEADMVTVNDPASASRSGKQYPLSMIQSELRREQCFMIVKP